MLRVLHYQLICIAFLTVSASADVYNGSFANGIIVDNCSTVGTMTNHLAVMTTNSPVCAQHALAGTAIAAGICLNGCGTTGQARILVIGQANCEFDGSTTARDYVVISPTVDGLCHDAGTVRPTHSRIVGLVTTTNAGPGIYPIILFGIGVQGAVETPLTAVGNFARDDGTWQPVTGGGLPSGLITMILSGSCPAGFTEATALNGKFLQGTLAANGDVGTTGGSATITPAGTVSQATFTGTPNSTDSISAGVPTGSNSTVSFTPSGTIAWPAGVPVFSGSALATHTHTFTGTALATHAHELPFQLVSSTSMRQLPASTFGTGTSRAAQGADTATANTTSAAVALSQAVSAGTPAGTNSSVSAGTPAGTIAWPASVPPFSGSPGTVPAETFTGSALPGHSHTVTPAGSVSAQTFTGSPVDPRPQFTKVIFCAAN